MNVLECVQHVAREVPDDALVVSSHTANSTACVMTGLVKRGLIGFNMGFATPVGLGLALALPHRRVITFDGDGGVILLASAMIDLATQSPKNLILIVSDNESELGFPTATSKGVDLEAMAKGAGVRNTSTVRTMEEFKKEFSRALRKDELSYIVAKVQPGMLSLPKGTSRPNLWENKFAFARHVEATEQISIISRKGKAMKG